MRWHFINTISIHYRVIILDIVWAKYGNIEGRRSKYQVGASSNDSSKN